jgi:2-polyprenyl-3-methyl-5-hydroxy-6-metoxy-1,4-benzoquinol methylase
LNASAGPESDRAQKHDAQSAVCPVCGSAAAVQYGVGRDRLFEVAPGTYRLLCCARCACIFQHPLPAEAELGKYYPEDYWWAPQARTESGLRCFLNQIESRYRELVTLDHVGFLERCARRNAPGRRALLDIGCGNGTFLHLARRRGFHPHGMDVSPRAVSIAREHYNLDVREGTISGDVWSDHAFDFVTMFHLLEHLPDPRRALRFAKARLRAGGSLIVQVPNAGSLQARLFALRWYGLDVPRHVVNFSPRALELLLAAEGFEIAAVRRFSLRDNPASLASSLLPCLDPLGRRVRRRGSRPAMEGALEVAYFGLFLASIPFALLESACGRGGTLWVEAKHSEYTVEEGVERD